MSVCLRYDDADQAAAAGGPLGLRLLKFSTGSDFWVPLTTEVDALNRQICATTSSEGALAIGISTSLN